MPVYDVPRNWKDYCADNGHQFGFSCDICGREYKSTFVTSKSSSMMKVGRFAGTFLGGSLGHALHEASTKPDPYAYSHGKAAGWSKEKDQAYMTAFNEVKPYFRKCPRDHAWACGDCWNAQSNLCVKCAPRLNVEMAAATAQVQVQQMHTAVQQTQLFKQPVEQRMAVCPSCGAPGGSGKFCNNCGAMLAQPKCPTCGAENAPNAKFCNGCGGKLA